MSDVTIKSCSFTGHRQIAKEHSEILTDLTKRAIEYAYNNGCRKFYLGGALGFDTLAAKEVLAFSDEHPDAELHLLLPCHDQDAKWGDEDREVYKQILKRADSVEYVNKRYTSTCMKERNAALVERADMLVAYMGRSYSGAGQTVRKAKEKGIPVYNLYPTCAEKCGG